MLVRRIAALLLCALVLGTLPGTASADPGVEARRKLELLTQKVQDAEEREGILADRLTALDRKLAVTERELAGIRARYAVRARTAYQSGLGGDTLVVLMSTDDPGAVIDRLDLFAAANSADDALLRRGAALRRVLRDQRREADDARKAVAQVRRDLAADSADLRDLLQRLAAEDAAKEAAAEARARASARAAAAQARSRNNAAPAPEVRALPRATRARVSGSYACLVGPTRAYRDTWGAPRSGGRRHKGVDVFAPMGSPAYAVTDGVVTRTSSSSNGGLQVYLRGNDGNEYFYAHMSSYVARAGQRVKAGELIARVGDTGNARGGPPHIHFELHPGGGVPINPYPFVRRTCG